MKRAIICLISLSFAMCSVISSEVSAKEYDHGVGAAAGFVTGYGLSYRKLGEKYSLQLTFAPYVQGKDISISFGTAVLKDLFIGSKSKLFAYSGIHYWYNKYTEKDEDEITLKGEWTDQWLNCGIGPGVEFRITDNIVFDLMAGYAVYLCDNEPTRLSFTGETALFFYFK